MFIKKPLGKPGIRNRTSKLIKTMPRRTKSNRNAQSIKCFDKSSIDANVNANVNIKLFFHLHPQTKKHEWYPS
jgi:hypothetical protein